MDAFTLMKKDHQKVADIFKKIIKTDDEDAKEREQLFKEVKNELDAHAYMEEKAFYPFVKEKSETHELALEAYEEHRIVKDLLKELDKMSADQEDWMAKLTVLKENVEHHVDEEENEMFPKVQKFVDKKEAEELGTKMEKTKAEFKVEA